MFRLPNEDLKMVAAFCDSDVMEPSKSLCDSADDALCDAALQRLQSSSYAALRRLRCEVNEAVVVVHGVLPSYYLKQIAQTLIQRLDGIKSVTNLVEVQAPEGEGTQSSVASGWSPRRQLGRRRPIA
jgi:hypothetical protein